MCNLVSDLAGKKYKGIYILLKKQATWSKKGIKTRYELKKDVKQGMKYGV